MSASDHGSVSTYRNYGCRCDLCKAANSAARREYRQRVELARHTPPPTPRRQKPWRSYGPAIDARIAAAAVAAVPYPRPRRFETPLKRRSAA